MPGAAAGTPAGRPPVLTVGFSLCSAPRLPQRPQREDRDMAEGLQVGAAGPGEPARPRRALCAPPGVSVPSRPPSPRGGTRHTVREPALLWKCFSPRGSRLKLPLLPGLVFGADCEKRRFRGAASVLRGPQEPWHSLE